MKLYCPECETRYEGEEHEVCPTDGSRLFQLDSASDEGDPLLNAVIDDRFRIEELLGAGGMGAVYRGIQLSVHREVAIKVLRPDLTDRELMLERFFREAKVVSELTHPNIVRLVEFGQDRERDLLYLVMELVRGVALGDLLEGNRVRTNLALEIVYQVCGALTEPHARGIVHRDMKPDNLIILPISDGTLQVKVLDFGIARALEGNTQLTKTGMICGTPSYMSPEQAQNNNIDGRTDLYSLGVILYQMITGQTPFRGDTALQVLLSHIQRPAPQLQQVMPAGTVPAPVCELVAELLSKPPEERPDSARSVRDRIDQIRINLQLSPVRLDTDDPFDAWLLPRVELNDAPPESDGLGDDGAELPVGLQAMSTGELGKPGPQTGEMEQGDTNVYERHSTEPEYIGVADTLNATPPSTNAATAESDEAKTVRGDYGGIEDRPPKDHTTSVVESAAVETIPRKPGGSPEDTLDSSRQPSTDSTTPVILGGAVVLFFTLFALAAFITYQVLGGVDDADFALVEQTESAEMSDEEPLQEDTTEAIQQAMSAASDEILEALALAFAEQEQHAAALEDSAGSDEEATGGAETTAGARGDSPAPSDPEPRPRPTPTPEPEPTPQPEPAPEPEPRPQPEAEPETLPQDSDDEETRDGRDEIRDRLDQLRRE